MHMKGQNGTAEAEGSGTMAGVSAKKALLLTAAAAGLFVFQSLAGKAGGLVAGFFDYASIDRDGVFMYITVHHLVQMAIACAAIVLVGKLPGRLGTLRGADFHLKPRLSRSGICCTAVFSVIITAYVFISYIAAYRLDRIEPPGYKLTAVNVLGSLGFQLLLSGTSEEILFRSLPVTLLRLLFPGPGRGRQGHSRQFLPVVIAAFLFSLAHIRWSLFPASVSCSCFQLVYAFILGIAYGITFLKSRSVLYPAVMHGLSNFVMVGTGYMFALI